MREQQAKKNQSSKKVESMRRVTILKVVTVSTRRITMRRSTNSLTNITKMDTKKRKADFIQRAIITREVLRKVVIINLVSMIVVMGRKDIMKREANIKKAKDIKVLLGMINTTLISQSMVKKEERKARRSGATNMEMEEAVVEEEKNTVKLLKSINKMKRAKQSMITKTLITKRWLRKMQVHLKHLKALLPAWKAGGNFRRLLLPVKE